MNPTFWRKLHGASSATSKTSRRGRTAFCVLSAAITILAAGCLTSCRTPAKSHAPETAAAPSQSIETANRQITGAELYSINCNRCHQERYPTERTGAQWKTIMLHMQVRANIPASQAKLILQFLQENSGR